MCVIESEIVVAINDGIHRTRVRRNYNENGDVPGGGCSSGGAGRKAAATAACALKAAAYATRDATDAGSGNRGSNPRPSDRLSARSPAALEYLSRGSRASDSPSSSWMANGLRCGGRGALGPVTACISSLTERASSDTRDRVPHTRAPVPASGARLVGCRARRGVTPSVSPRSGSAPSPRRAPGSRSSPFVARENVPVPLP